ncbi:DUF927 domain-containing protein [Sporosarcina sp. SAFN-010]|uniref:DUF927 domain-containing protein n=1 Tax=Sporosarcina sp. SAFN-010 TaxID=3387273 RepID=UPI003F7D108D
MATKLSYKYELLPDSAVTTLPNSSEEVSVGKYIVTKNYLYVQETDMETGKKIKSKLSQLVWIDKVYRTLDNGTVLLEIIFFSRGQYHRVTTTREIFNEKNIMMLTEKGADVRADNYKQIVRFLQQQEQTIRHTHYLHTALGWKQSGNELVYYHYHSISGKTIEEPSGSVQDIRVKEVASLYTGQLAIQPTGKYAVWKETIQQQVLGRPALEFALVYGFAAVVNALLSKYLPLEVLLVHIYGDSSTGKTTASRLAISSFGKPSVDGLLKNWNATFNALMKVIARNHGLPIVLDESSTKTNSDFTSVIYQLAEGRDKNRLNSDIELREQEKWSGAFLSTGEHRLTEKSNQNSGLLVRLPEFGNIAWTESAAHAEAIKNALENNYGHAGPQFVQHVIDTFEQETWEAELDKWKKTVVKAMTIKDGFSERIAEKYAVMLLTGQVMNACFDFDIQLDSLLDFIIENDQENIGTRSLESKSMDFLQQKIIEHQAKFNVGDRGFSGTACYGAMKKKQDYLEVSILKTVVDTWLADGGFSSSQVVLKGLKKEGILDNEAGKNTRQRQVVGEAGKPSKQTVYVLKLPFELLEVVSTLPKATPLSSPTPTNIFSTTEQPVEANLPNLD